MNTVLRLTQYFEDRPSYDIYYNIDISAYNGATRTLESIHRLRNENDDDFQLRVFNIFESTKQEQIEIKKRIPVIIKEILI